MRIDTQQQAIQDRTNYGYRRALRVAGKLHRGRNLLTVGDRYGKLTMLPAESMKRIDGVTHYECECDCGTKIYLRTYEVLARRTLDEGCATDDCPLTTLAGKRWLNPKFSLRQQWAFYLYTDPFNVDNKWGGCMFRNEKIKTERIGLKKFMTFAHKLVDIRRAKVWIRKIETTLPFTEDNVKISVRKPAAMFETPWAYMYDGNEYHTHGDIATLLNTNINTVMQERMKYFYSFDAYCSLVALTT